MEGIRKRLDDIKKALIVKIKDITINKTVEITGKKYQDIQAFIKGRRKWSYEKILDISEKVGVYHCEYSNNCANLKYSGCSTCKRMHPKSKGDWFKPLT